MSEQDIQEPLNPEGIALIGMSGRFPGAATVRDLWRNLCDGVDSIRHFTPEELEAAGVPPELAGDPSYVPASGVLEQIEDFDARFFGFSPREAEALDPQDRLFLECSLEALEDAGYDPARVEGPVGVYGGEFLDTYLFRNLYANPAYMANADPLLVRVLNDKDFLTTLVSYKLNLRGPSVAIQTACSTSLVAVHMACESLLSFQGDLALAGGVSITVPHRVGYRYREGSIFAPDGRCRPFAADARGTVAGNGAGVVVLKRLAEALEDDDQIYAVIRGTAINNDGSLKAGYTAPSVDGQAEVVATAQSVAGIDPSTISYIEAHGTGTEVGDPIEVAALQQVFGAATERKNFCGLGSLKSNLGHLEAAAGVAGLIKTALALQHRTLPASLHCTPPNPALNLEDTAFSLVDETRPWANGGGPRRAGVSSFGVGGTNAHVVLEEAPSPLTLEEEKGPQLLTLSAATSTALATVAERLSARLEGAEAAPDDHGSSPPRLADAAFTLQVGRQRLRHRRALVCEGRAEAAATLRHFSEAVTQRPVAPTPEGDPSVVFLFPGQGAQYPGMGQELYEQEEVFRREVDRCAEVLRPLLGQDLRELMWPGASESGSDSEAAARLERTAIAQPALFVMEWALAQTWITWGVRPAAMIGHSLGEYVAATVAGVFTLEEGLRLVAERGRLMEAAPEGAMLAVHLPEAEALTQARQAGAAELVVAAQNAPALTVLSGPHDAVDRLVAHLSASEPSASVEHRRLHTSHAFHSPTMESVREPLGRSLAMLPARPPAIPYLSNLTGDWMGEEAVDPTYWLQHLLSPVRFVQSLALLLEETDVILLEVGPGESLSRLARQQPAWRPSRLMATSLPHPRRPRPAGRHLLEAVGCLWEAGVEIDWQGVHGDRPRRRVSLPTYPFERRRYWVPAPPVAGVPPLESVEAVAGSEPAATTSDDPTEGQNIEARPPWLPPYVEPRTEDEATVAEIFSVVLAVPEVGVEDDFFELGGHSLLATQVVARLRQRLGIVLPLAELHESPTPAGLALRVEQWRAEKGEVRSADLKGPSLVPDPAAAHEPFPLTDVQEAYWVGRGGAFELGEVATHWYIEVEEGGLQVDRFEAAWRRLIERHDALRTVILEDGRQRILEAPPEWSLPLVDARDLPAAIANQVAESVRHSMSHQVLDAASWPLFDLRATLLPGERIRIHFSLDLLIADAWSFVLLTRELAHFYHRPESTLPTLEATFRDYVVAERALRDGEEYLAALEYWRQHLAILPPAPELPLARRPEELGRPRFKRRTANLEPQLWSGLKRAARQRGVTPSGIVLAVLAEVLGAWSKNPRFTLNLTLFNRLPLHPDIDSLVGDFTSLTLLAVETGDGTFEQRARRLQGRLWRDLDHRQVSGVTVIRELARISGGTHRARMPVVFTSTLGMESDQEEVEGLPGEVVYSISQTPQVWIDVQVRERAGALRFNWDAVEELFPDGLLDTLFGTFCRLLEVLGAESEAEDASTAWARRAFDLVPTDHLETRRRINASDGPAPQALLHEPFLDQAVREGERLAVLDASGGRTYREVETLSRRLAWVLREQEVKPGELVAVLLPKGWRQVVAVLAISRSGAAYLPIDPTLPAERIQWLLRYGGVRVAVTEEGAVEAPDAWPSSIQRLSIKEGTARGDQGPVTCGAEPNDLCYVIFTSGSSGLPKGVVMEHAAVLNTLVDVSERFSVGADDRVLALSSLSFDLSVYDIFGLLAAGGATVLPSDDDRREPARWQALMQSAGVTVWNSVPALLGMLVEHLEERWERLPASLRLILLSGDWIPVDLPARVHALSDRPDLQLVSLGGATEAAVWSILHPIEEVDPEWTSIPYGRPMRNQRFHVLNEALDECPEWVTGHLYIAGDGLARGYWRDPERTDASFFQHPRTGERLYATGDLGRWRPGGLIEFLGREDGQVKIGGYRIEVGEVEAAVLAHPLVSAAAVVAVGEARGARRLVAHLVLESVDRKDPRAVDSVQSFVEARLPEYMIPSLFVPRDSFPLSANGKVDRKALAAQDIAPQSKPESVAPSHPLEQVIAEIWAEVLDREAVGAEENFFELGGDSVLATRITARLAASLGMEVPLRALFASPTVAGLAAALARSSPEAAVVLSEPIPRRQPGPAPLSFQQQRMWFLQQLDPDSPIYHLPRALRLRGKLRVAALAEALGMLDARQEALRIRFEHRADTTEGVRQTPAPPTFRPLPVSDLSGLGPAAASLAQTLVQEVIDRPFDLENGPLWRAHLLRLGEEEHILVLNFHHLVSDGWSIGVVSRHLEAAYPALSRRQAPDLPDLPAQYSDYAVWQRQRLTADLLEEQMSFWRQHLDAAPRHLELPTDRPRPAAQTYRGAGVAFTLPPTVTRAVTDLARQKEGTPFLVLGAVFTALLGRLAGQDDVVVGTPVANRNRPELEPLLGLFVNTVVLRAQASCGATFESYFDAFKETSLRALSHQEMPFERLVDELAPERDVRRTPIFQALFVHQSVIQEMEQLGSLRVNRVGFRAETAMFDLSLTLAETAAGTAGWLEYNSDLFDASTARRWAAAYGRLVNRATAEPETPLADLPWLSAAQRQQVRWEWSSTAPALETAPVHELVARWARRQPTAPALESGGVALSYGQLMERVENLVYELQRLGVGPENRVGLALERSAAAVIAMLAVLRSGAAYVPLDPADPAARRAEVIRDAGLRWVLVKPGDSTADLGVTLVPVADVEAVDARGAATSSSESESVGVESHSLAYVIYTSGSTGQPKGVLVPHGTLARHTAAAADRFGIGPGDRVLQFASLAFDTSAEEIFPCLTRGATLVVRGAGPAGPPAELFAELAAAGITLLDLPTAYWHLAATALAAGEATLPVSLRLVIVGGERALGAAAKDWVEAVGRAGRDDLRTLNTYGPTEATIVATHGALPAYQAGAVAVDPDLGRPIAGTRAFLADPAGRLVAPGRVGEMLLAGGGVTRGYLGRPGLTADRFLPDPWSGEAGARLYRSGDLARWLGDGRIAFVGRVDQQVKVRGFRVEPGEIEARLQALPEVAEAVVVSRRLQAGHDDLVAYVLGDGKTPPLMPAVRRALAAELPSWMMPGVFVVLESFPRTAGGKVDVRRLPEPEGRRGEQAAEYASPVSLAEIAVAEIWRAVLGLDRVGLYDNFFDLGGNSMLLMQVYQALRRRFERPLLLIDLLQNPTVQAQANHLAESQPVPTFESVAEESDRGAQLRKGRQRLLARRRRR